MEELYSSIAIAVPENKPLTLMCDYNLNYFNRNERDCLQTVLVQYGLQVLKPKYPTRVQGTSKSLIDYIFSDNLQAKIFKTYVSDSPFRTIKKKGIDHRATSTITNSELNNEARNSNEPKTELA